MVNRYHAEVIGSLLRPQYLKDARKQWEAGQLSTREFKRSEDRAVDEMIALQERSGVDVITDGEMRRSQVSTGDRSAKIRTYNFPQGRVTDHRIGLTMHKLPQVLEGDLDELTDALTLADRASRLAEAGSSATR